jgi:hypothetical protein
MADPDDPIESSGESAPPDEEDTWRPDGIEERDSNRPSPEDETVALGTEKEPPPPPNLLDQPAHLEDDARHIAAAENRDSAHKPPYKESDSGIPEGSPLAALIQVVPPLAQKSAEMFAKWLGIPPSAKYLKPVLDSLKQREPDVVAVAEREGFEVPEMFTVGSWALRQALRDPHVRLNMECFRPSWRENDPTWGVQSKGHQLYAALPYRPKRDDLRTPHDQLQAHLLVTALRLWDTRLPGHDYRQDDLLEAAALAVRSIWTANFLPHLPGDPVTQANYRIQLLKLLQETEGGSGELRLSDDHRRYLTSIYKLLAIFEEPVSDTISLETPVRTMTPDDTDSDFILHIHQEVHIEPSEVRQVRNSGMALEESAGDTEYATLDAPVHAPRPDKPPQRPATIAQQVRARKHQIAAEERGNQLLPVAWQRLCRHEMAAFLHQISTVLRHALSDRTLGGDVTLEATALLTTSFWTARSIAASLDLVLIASRLHLPADGKLTGIAFIIESSEWCMPALRPKKAPSFAGVDFTLAEPVSPLLFLPAHPATATFIRRLPATNSALTNGTARAFRCNPSEVDARVDKILRGVGSRITRERIEKFLFFCLLDKTRDLGAASLTAGYPHHLADTALHYANYEQETLQDRYSEVCREIYGAAYAERSSVEHALPLKDPIRITPKPLVATALPPAIPYLDSPTTIRVGTPICPRTVTIRRLREAVLSAFENILKCPSQPEYLVKHHNLLVLYTVLMLKDATGYRDIISPLPRRSDIDLEDNTILVSDKDDAASFNTRVLPLLEPLRQQLIETDHHLRILASRAVLAAPELSRDLYYQFGLAPEPPPEPESDSGDDKNNAIKKIPTPPLFFLKTDQGTISVDPVRPTTLKQVIHQCAPWYLLPTNANRASLRRRLLAPVIQASDTPPVPPDGVDYFLSHWVRGREPLGRFATLPLQVYLDQLSPRLTQILQEDGWTVLEGLR